MGCQRCKVAQWSDCVIGNFGVQPGLESKCPGATVLCTPGYTNCYVASFAVALVSGCDRSWTDWNSWNLRGAGLCG
jgi:hypothetical protein